MKLGNVKKENTDDSLQTGITSKAKEKIMYARLKRKDKEAFIKAYDLYLDHIYRFVYFKVSDTAVAEDLTSSVFLKTWDYIQNNNLKEYKTLRSLLYKVARNLVIDHYRKQSTQLDVSIEKEPAMAMNIADDNQDVKATVEVMIDFQKISEKLFELKDEYREVITLRYINELSISEIAEVLGKTKGNTRVLIYRALQALREIAKEE